VPFAPGHKSSNNRLAARLVIRGRYLQRINERIVSDTAETSTRHSGGGTMALKKALSRMRTTICRTMKHIRDWTECKNRGIQN